MPRLLTSHPVVVNCWFQTTRKFWSVVLKAMSGSLDFPTASLSSRTLLKALPDPSKTRMRICALPSPGSEVQTTMQRPAPQPRRAANAMGPGEFTTMSLPIGAPVGERRRRWMFPVLPAPRSVHVTQYWFAAAS